MGLGLDRLLMLRKGMENIRLLRSDDSRIVDQMLSLSPYRPVSDQPAIRRDLSIAVPEDRTAEELGDRVREALGQRSELVESVEVLSETAYGDLPPAAIERLGISSGQKNTLLRVVLRDLRHTPSVLKEDGDRWGNSDDRIVADRECGLPKPDTATLGVVIGPIGGFRNSDRKLVV